jgi:hypothetical protein
MRPRLVRTENRKWMIMLDNRPDTGSSTVRVRRRLGTSEG